ncbi:hypothetical protein BGX23_001557 [Mortierella sp. AD031]|nr:hypothetical protein BGX23_001557 [Mortierella sp. AD031]
MSRLIKLDYSSDRQYKGSNFAIALGLCNATPMHFPLCWVLENSCTTLTQVHLHELDLPYIEAIRVLARTLSKLQVLARLQIAYNSNANNKVGSNSDKTPPTTTLLNILFFCCPPSLVSFIMVGRLLALKRYPGLEGLLQPREGQLDWDEGKVLIRQEPLLNLKELLLPACPQGYTAEEICPILEHCPNLDCWSIPDFKYDSTRTEVLRVFRETIPRRYGHPSRLLAITSTPCLQFRGEGVIEIMEALPEQQLRDIVCQHFYDASHVRFAAAIMRHSETLQNFLINRSNGVQSSTIQTVLANCKALKVLWVSSNRGGGSIRLLLEDAVAQDWACTRLDQLKIFMDLGSSGALGDVLLTEVEQQERWVKLEKFYRQLGRLTELSILDIRCVRGLNTLMGGLTIPYQKLSLPGLLSLPKAEEGEEGPGTGVGRKRGYLHLLARLKDLRMIRGSFWAHTVENREMVGQAEMEWIVKTFPKLEQFELMPENYQALGGYVVPEHLRWLQRERPQLVLFRAGEQEKK